MAILKAVNAEKEYVTQAENVQALSGVNFEINPGDFIIINGPSGSGKTTLLNLLAGIDQPTGGEIFINEQKIKMLSDAERTTIRCKQIGLIFQSFELIPVLTAAENIEYPLLLQKIKASERQKRVLEILSQVGLSELAQRYPEQLSGGQKQRVAIARALITKPQIVLADEPTGNLDSTTGKKIIELMLSLNQNYKVAFIIVTHDLTLNKYAQKVFRIKDGQLTLLTEANRYDQNCLA